MTGQVRLNQTQPLKSRPSEVAHIHILKLPFKKPDHLFRFTGQLVSLIFISPVCSCNVSISIIFDCDLPDFNLRHS